MTPNTSDSPEAMRNRNIAVVRPPRNCPNRNDTSTIAQPFMSLAPQHRAIERASAFGWFPLAPSAPGQGGVSIALPSNKDSDPPPQLTRKWLGERRQFVYGP